MAASTLVIGATTTMGKAIVRRLAFSGYKVAAAGECPDAVGKVAEDNKKVGGDVTAFSVDVTKAEYRKELIEKVVEHLGGLDSVIIVPPQNKSVGEIVSCTSLQFDKVFEDYLSVPFRIAQSSIPALAKSKNGSVVFMTSSIGYTPSLDMGIFSVAANAVLGLTKAVAQAAAVHNVRVNSVVCGMVEGDGTSALWDNATGEDAQKLRQQLESMIPIGRLGRPSDAASLAEFLISSKARYITGENCVLNGGVSYRL